MAAIDHAIIVHGDTIFISGVIGLNKQGQLVCGGVKEQVVQVLENLKCILESVGATLRSVVQTSIMLTDIEDMGDIHKIYSKLVMPAGSPPQTSAVGGMGRNAATVAQIPSRYLCRRDVMGCTSSTQHLHTPTSTQHKRTLLVADDAEEVKEIAETDDLTKTNSSENIEGQRRLNDLATVATCDKDSKPSDLAQSVEEINTEMTEKTSIKDELETTVTAEIEDSNITSIYTENTSQADDRFSTLEEVVEKVVELYGSDIHSNADEFTIASEKEQTIIETTPPVLIEDKPEEKTIEAEVRQELASPSESSSSRATRWEALADIAAELPPSLAVDPLTGQIYVLSK